MPLSFAAKSRKAFINDPIENLLHTYMSGIVRQVVIPVLITMRITFGNSLFHPLPTGRLQGEDGL
jgi:hypothetical protein